MTTTELQNMSKKLRLEAVRMVYEGKDGHPGPALSIADIIATLYFDGMKLDPANPAWEDRDRLILSKGHACPVLYAALNEKGYFGERISDFKLRALHSRFQGHPVMEKTGGVDMISGSLGNGIALGAGMAMAGKRRHRDYRVFVIVGDGELQEGVVWEGVNAAAAHKLDNLIVFIDKNGFQSGGAVVDIIGSNDIKERFEAFNWYTQEINGHDIDEIKSALAHAKTHRGTPCAIVCDCVKGKGLDFMEGDNTWHKRVPDEGQFELAKKTLGDEK